MALAIAKAGGSFNASITPLVAPPPGIESNFVNPATRGDGFRAVVIGFTLLGGICTIIRLYTRVWIIRKVGWDDCEAF